MSWGGYETSRTAPNRSHRLAPRSRPGRERRHCLHRKLGRRCRRGSGEQKRDLGRRCRRPGGRCIVNGRRRVRVRQLQADTERADIARERTELAADPAAEEKELAAIYVRRGLAPSLARTVAQQLTAHDALKAHTRDELGLFDQSAARPLQAALASAATFAVGAALPILTIMLAPEAILSLVVAAVSLASLAALGALAARVGGASAVLGAGRVAFWGALAMGITAGVGAWFGTAI